MSRALNDLCPRLRPLACELIARAAERQIAVLIVDTLRTEREHAANLANGRSWTTRSKHLAQPACCGRSHAIDLAPFEEFRLHGPDKLAWNGSEPAWAVLGGIGKSLGLRWGGDWRVKDLGHFELVE